MIDGRTLMSEYVFHAKYSRWNEKLQRRMTWEESVEVNLRRDLNRLKDLPPDVHEEVKRIYKVASAKKVAPAMRSLQWRPQALEAHNAKIFNCASRFMTDINDFAEVFYLLLCGCGVTAVLNKKYLTSMPKLANKNDKNGIVVAYQVEDTIEGWARALLVLLMSYTHNNPFTGRKIVFDYSRIRPKGSPLKTSGGKAPGYEGLKQSLNRIKDLLDFIIEVKHQKELKTVDITDIICHASDAVLSGGIRRAAVATIFEIDDEDMLNSKSDVKVRQFDLLHRSDGSADLHGETEDGFRFSAVLDPSNVSFVSDQLVTKKTIFYGYVYPWRRRTNNSVRLLRNKVSREKFHEITEVSLRYGDPGFVFTDSVRSAYNPCFEAGMIPFDDNEVPGVSFCNLTSINGSFSENEDVFREQIEAAVVIGMLQSTYTDIPFLTPSTKNIMERDNLLGVSISGFFDQPDVLLNNEILRRGAKYAVEVATKWAGILGLNVPKRITLVKPEGTWSIVSKTSSGAHPDHAPMYWRRVTENKMSPVLNHFKKHNPHLVSHSVNSATGSDDVISFPVRSSSKTIVKKDLTAIEHLKIIRDIQTNWVVPGCSDRDDQNKEVSHNVSCTVEIRDEEREETLNYIYDNRDFFSAVSVIPYWDSTNSPFQQLPLQRVEEGCAEFEEAEKNLKNVDYTSMVEEDDNTKVTDAVACAGGSCSV